MPVAQRQRMEQGGGYDYRRHRERKGDSPLKEITEGMAFYQANALTKYWIYKREGKWSFVYPFHHENLNLQGYRIPCDTFEEALDELHFALNNS